MSIESPEIKPTFLQLVYQLTTEMRVLAFACLGIDDTNMIARFLGLSHNTIYTYRNRMRARALDRNTFDRSVQRIGLPA